MRKIVLCCSFAMVVSGAAFAQGEGEGEGEADCGAITEEGECQGAEAVYCYQNALQRVNCADLAGDGSITAGTCEVYAGFGSWCAFNDGDACAFQTGDGQNITFACATDTSGCVNGTCTANVGACTPDAQGADPTVQCLDGATLQYGCSPWAQASGFGCAELGTGSTCENSQCVNIGEGGGCDGEVAVCADGLTCTANECTSGGGGEGEGEEGEGEGDAECESDRDCDDGEICSDGECQADSAEPAPLCSDTGASKGLPAAGLLALAGMVLGLRRRRA